MKGKALWISSVHDRARTGTVSHDTHYTAEHRPVTTAATAELTVSVISAWTIVEQHSTGN